MFKFNTPIRIKYEIQSDKILFQINAPCTARDDWTEINEFPSFKDITDTVEFIGEFGETEEVDPSDWPQEKQEALQECLTCSMQFCFAVLGHSDPMYVFTCTDKAIAVHLMRQKLGHDSELEPLPFNFIPVEANGKMTNLEKLSMDLFLPTPDGPGQIEWIGDAMESDYRCGEISYVRRFEDVVLRKDRSLGILD